MVPGEGFEPPTFGLQNHCTTAVLTRQWRYFSLLVVCVGRAVPSLPPDRHPGCWGSRSGVRRRYAARRLPASLEWRDCMCGDLPGPLQRCAARAARNHERRQIVTRAGGCCGWSRGGAQAPAAGVPALRPVPGGRLASQAGCAKHPALGAMRRHRSAVARPAPD